MATLHLISNYFIANDVVDEDQDLLKIELVDPQNITITKVSVTSLTPASGSATIVVGNQANGLGDEIVITFSNGEFYAESSGQTIETTTTFFWIRSGNPFGLSNINVGIRYNY